MVALSFPPPSAFAFDTGWRRSPCPPEKPDRASRRGLHRQGFLATAGHSGPTIPQHRHRKYAGPLSAPDGRTISPEPHGRCRMPARQVQKSRVSRSTSMPIALWRQSGAVPDHQGNRRKPHPTRPQRLGATAVPRPIAPSRPKQQCQIQSLDRIRPVGRPRPTGHRSVPPCRRLIRNTRPLPRPVAAMP